MQEIAILFEMKTILRSEQKIIKNDFEDLLILCLAVFLFDAKDSQQKLKVIKLSGTESDQCNLSLRNSSKDTTYWGSGTSLKCSLLYCIAWLCVVLHQHSVFLTLKQIMQSLFLLV